jgi:hypothetical protein
MRPVHDRMPLSLDDEQIERKHPTKAAAWSVDGLGLT